METVVPQDVIETHASAVEYPPHRQRLQQHLGRISQTPSVELDTPTPEQPDTQFVEQQIELVAHYYAKASTELGNEAEENDIWDAVTRFQLSELRDPEFQGDRDALATSVMVGNLLAAFGTTGDERKEAVEDRVWRLASSRQGVTFLQVARDHQGLCVNTGNDDKPFESISEQVKDFGGLLMATDKSVDMETMNIPVYELTAAKPEKQAWFISGLVDKGNLTAALRNLELIPDKRAFCESIAKGYGYMKADQESLTKLGLQDVITQREIIDVGLDEGVNVTFRTKFEELSADDQIHAFNRIVSEQPEKLDSYFSYSTGFNKLGVDQLQKLLDIGFYKRGGSYDFSIYHDLPTGALDLVRDRKLGLNLNNIIRTCGSFSVEDRQKLYDDLVTNPDVNAFESASIFSHPANFDFIGRDKLIVAAREQYCLNSLASAIEWYTDGSDQALILELLDKKEGPTIAGKINQLPALDAEWLIGELQAREDYSGLIEALPFMSSIDQQELFDKCVNNEKAGFLLGYKLANFTELDRQATLEQLIDKKLFGVVLPQIDYFAGETPETIFERVSNSPEALTDIADNIYRFPFIDRGWLVDALAVNQKYKEIGMIADDVARAGVDPEHIFSLLADHPDALQSTLVFGTKNHFVQTIGEMRIFNQIKETGGTDTLEMAITHFTDPEVVAECIEAFFEAKNDNGIFRALISSELPLDKMAIIERCCRMNWEEPLVNLDGYWLPDSKTLIEWGAAATLIMHSALYPDVDQNEMFRRLIERDDADMIGRALNNSRVKKFPNELADYILGSPFDFQLVRRKEAFDKAAFTPEFIEKAIAQDFDGYGELYEYAGIKIDWLEKGMAVFGKDSAAALMLATKEIDSESAEPLSADFQDLGIKQRGQAGINQLNNAFNRLRSDLVYGAQSIEDLQKFVSLTTNNSLAKAIAKQLTRFSTSQWGQHSEDAWSAVLNNHLNVAAEVRPLNPDFTVSPEYQVRTIDAKEFDPSRLDQDAVNRFNILRDSVDMALKIAEHPAHGRYDELFNSASEILFKEADRLQNVRLTLEAKGNQKGLASIDRQIGAINEVSQAGPKEFMRLVRTDFQRLLDLKVKELEPLIRAGFYSRAIRRSADAKALAQSITDSDASYNNLLAMDDFVEHLVNNEVFGNYFSNDTSRKAFQKLSDTTALRSQILKIQGGQTSGQTALQFVPSRGLLLELSGHIGDACWASKYNSIAETFPGITALAYVRNPGKSTERLVGAGMIIETRDETTGEDIVVLRGTNPIQNYINGVKVEDFFENLTNYVKSIAGSRRIAMVIDGLPGQAATNRPALHTYLKQVVKPALANPEPLNLPEDTTFNSYVLSPQEHPVYYLN